MSFSKRMMEEVAGNMGNYDPTDPKVLAEVGRLMNLDERRFVVLETHPNSGGCWIGKIGTESEVISYLKEMAVKGVLEYVGGIVELKEKAEEEIGQWIEFEEYQPIRVQVRPPHEHTGPTPPLPGLEKRLAHLEVEAYGLKKSAWSLLQGMYDNEIEEVLSDTLEAFIQSGRMLPPWEKEGQKEVVVKWQ